MRKCCDDYLSFDLYIDFKNIYFIQTKKKTHKCNFVWIFKFKKPYKFKTILY